MPTTPPNTPEPVAFTAGDRLNSTLTATEIEEALLAALNAGSGGGESTPILTPTLAPEKFTFSGELVSVDTMGGLGHTFANLIPFDGVSKMFRFTVNAAIFRSGVTPPRVNRHLTYSGVINVDSTVELGGKNLSWYISTPFFAGIDAFVNAGEIRFSVNVTGGEFGDGDTGFAIMTGEWVDTDLVYDTKINY